MYGDLQEIQYFRKFGHSMFRLVICKPGRERGAKCLGDEAYHMIINFSANINEENLDLFKGLNGSYPSHLVIENFATTRDRYTKRQFQDLYMVPLVLTRKEINSFVDRVIEVYWSYSGRYRFLSNNCATESLSIIKSVFPFREDIQNLHVVRPKSLIDKFDKAGIANKAYVSNLKRKSTRGYYFPSTKNKQQLRYMILSRNFLELKDLSLKQYLNETNADFRKKIIAKYEEALTLRQKIAFWNLEENIKLLKIHEMSQNKIAEIKNAQEKNAVNNDEAEALIRAVLEFKNPVKYLRAETSRYGIPHISDIDFDQNDSVMQDEMSHLVETSDKVVEVNNPEYQALVKELKTIKENIQYIKSIK